MRRPTRDPLADASLLLVDGTNLLHALRRGRDPLPSAAVVGRLRAVVPGRAAVVVVLDGAPAPGGSDRRLTAGVEVRYAGARPADDLLRDLAAGAPPGTLAVTDDVTLAAALRALGAGTVRTTWLADRLARQRLEAPSVGRPRPPQPAPGEDRDAEPKQRAWRPGRGATAKRGNPKRGHPDRPGR